MKTFETIISYPLKFRNFEENLVGAPIFCKFSFESLSSNFYVFLVIKPDGHSWVLQSSVLHLYYYQNITFLYFFIFPFLQFKSPEDLKHKLKIPLLYGNDGHHDMDHMDAFYISVQNFCNVGSFDPFARPSPSQILFKFSQFAQCLKSWRNQFSKVSVLLIHAKWFCFPQYGIHA